MEINLRENSKDDVKLSIALSAPFLVLTVQYFVLAYFNLFDTSLESAIQVASKLMVGFAFAYALAVVWKKQFGTLFLVYGITIFIFLWNILMFNQNMEYLKNMIFPFFLISIPCFVYAKAIKDLNTFMRILEWSSYVIALVGVLLGFLMMSGRIKLESYSMSLGYYMLLPAVIFVKRFFDGKSIINLLMATLLIVITIIFGSRGPLICIGAYIILYQLINIKKMSTKKLILLLILSIILIFGFIYFDQILNSMINILDQMDLNSRTLRLFLSEEVYLSGRDSIYARVLGETMKHPMLGLGLMGDRVMTETYSHNFYLEVISGFGIIVGGLLCIVTTYIILKSIISKNKAKANYMLMWITIGFVPLMVSGSYLTDFQFWIMLGLMLGRSQCYDRKRESEGEK